MDAIDNIYRINDFTLLELTFPSGVKLFHSTPKVNSTSKQFFTDDNFLSQYVWETPNEFRKINKLYNTDYLITKNTSGVITDQLELINCNVLLKQGFDWSKYMGLHIIVKSSKSDDTLFSGLISTKYFIILSKPKTYGGSIWPENFAFPIPKISEPLVCQITPIEFGKVDIETMEMYDFPTDFIPLVNERPLPEFIKLQTSIDENGYINLKTKTSENKTLEASLLYYFGLELANISISYIIQYGNEHFFKKIKVTNELNKYAPLNIGLNYVEFLDEELNSEQLISIFVTLEIVVNSMTIQRTVELSYDTKQLNPIIQNKLVKPEIIYPVEVKNETIVRPTIIEAKETTKIVKIFQPIFIEFITDDIIFERKNISFNNVTQKSYLVVDASKKDPEQVIISNETSDGGVYFDLTKLSPISEPTTYEILLAHNHSIIGRGNFLIK